MTSWRANLRPASFRGVAFLVEGSDFAGGRRIALHEYPQRDEPFAEDLGRGSRRYSISAVLIGDDYMTRRDALVAALETSGPGTLVDPYRGSLTVQVETFAVSELRDEGRMARIQMQFVEAGPLLYPSAATSTAGTVRGGAAGLLAAAQSAFAAAWSVAALPNAILGTALAMVSQVAAVVSAVVGLPGAVLGLAASLTSKVSLLVHDGTDLAAAVGGLFADPEYPAGPLGADVPAYTAAAGAARIRALLRAAQSAGTAAAAAAPRTPRGRQALQQQANADALGRLVRQTALAQAAVVAAGTAWESYDDAAAVLDPLIAAIDAETVLAADDASYVALADLQAAVEQDRLRRALRLPRLVTVTPPQVLPALVLAYDRYEDATREADITARNRLRHPGFIPVAPLRLLDS